MIYHPKVFSLNINNSYKFLNSPGIKDAEFNSYFEKIGKGIFNVLFNLKTLPIIKYKENWFAESIVSVIQESYNITFDKFPELKEEFPRRNNTLLIILDRDTDLPIMLHHASSLGSMINDLFGISRKKSTNNQFEIDPLVDYIWNNYLSTDFPTVHGKISEELKSIIEQTKFLDGTSHLNNEVSEVSKQINSTLEGLRDLTLKQNVLKNHANFAEKLSTEIKSRFLDKFYDLEYSLLSKRKFSSDLKKKYSDLLVKKSKNPTFQSDCLRIILMNYLLQNKSSTEDLKELESMLDSLELKHDSFEFLKQKKSFEESVKKDNSGGDSEGNSFFQYISSKSKSIIRGLITSEQPSIIADLVNSLSANKDIPNFVSYNLIKKSIDTKVNTEFSQVIVFLVGGGGLAEFEYLDQLLIQNYKNVNLYINL